MLLMLEVSGCPPEGTSGQGLGGGCRCSGETSCKHRHMVTWMMGRCSYCKASPTPFSVTSIEGKKRSWVLGLWAYAAGWKVTLANETRQFKGKVGVGEFGLQQVEHKACK